MCYLLLMYHIPLGWQIRRTWCLVLVVWRDAVGSHLRDLGFDIREAFQQGVMV